MNYASDILKGALIGIANIIPGVSGGTIAVSMGIYDKIIHSVTHLHKETKKSLLTLFPYGIGVLLGIVGLSFAIEFLFGHYPLPTSLTFIGLILGGLPAILSKVSGKKIPAAGYVSFFLMFALVSGMALMEDGAGPSVTITFSLLPVIKLFFIGMTAAATMVIPGVSGSMLLMLLGYYQPLITSINRFMIGAVTLDFGIVLEECRILAPFGIGVAAGIFLCAKLIELFLAHFEQITYCAILGLVISSPVVILMGIDPLAITAGSILGGLVCFAGALIFTIRLGK